MQNEKQKKFMPLPLWTYVCLWLFFVYLYVFIVQFQVEQSSNLLIGGLYFIEFGVHEASHLAVAFLPSIFVAAAGSFGEIAFTLLIVFAAWKAKSYFAVIFGALWVALAMNSVGRYMADARAQQLPLIGPGETVQHDWNFVFTQLGWLNADTIIGTTVRGLGDLIGLVALGFGLWLLLVKLTNGSNDTSATANQAK